MLGPPPEVLRARLQRDRCANLSKQLEADLRIGSGGAETHRRWQPNDGKESFLKSLTPKERQALLSKVSFSQVHAEDLKDGVLCWADFPTEGNGPASPANGAPTPSKAGPKLSGVHGGSQETIASKKLDNLSKVRPLDLARLRVQLASLAAENDMLRHQSRAASQAASRASTTAASAVANAQVQGQRLSEDTAARLAELEMQLSRHKAALRDLSTSAEQLAKDNVALAAEAVRHKTDKEEGTEKIKTLEGQVSHLQELYVTGVAPLKKQTHLQAKSRRDFWATLATPEVLELSRPPTDFPVPELEEMPTHIRPLLGKVHSQERERAELEKEVKKLSSKCTSLEEENQELLLSSKRDRHKLRQISASAKTRLIGSVRRIHYLVQQEQQLKDKLKAKEEYITKLEKHLLAQHHTLQARGSTPPPPIAPPASPKARAEAGQRQSPLRTEPTTSSPVGMGARGSTRVSPGTTHFGTSPHPTIDSKSLSTTPGDSTQDPILKDESSLGKGLVAPRKRRHSAIGRSVALSPVDAATTSTGGSPLSFASHSTPASDGNAALWGTPLAGLSQEMQERLGPVASSWRLFTTRGSSSGSSSDGSRLDSRGPALSSRPMDTPETIPEALPSAAPSAAPEDVTEDRQQPGGAQGVGDGRDTEKEPRPSELATLDEVSALTRRLKELHSAADSASRRLQ